MRTGEIVDLANERRLSASLDFARGAAELLVLNGGSRAEEIAVVTTVRGRSGKRVRSVYCIDSGTSLQVRLPLPAGCSPREFSVAIVGGHGSMLLSDPVRPRPPRVVAGRALASIALLVALFAGAGGRLDAPTLVASADPEPAPIDAPLVASRVSLVVPAHLPRVMVQATHIVRLPAGVAVRAPKLTERRVITVASAPVHVERPAVSAHRPPDAPLPRMTDLHVPSTAKSGDFVPVRFGAVGRQVKIVASIGPTIVSKTIIAAQHGVIAIRSPKSDRDSRIMTVRAYAQDGKRSSTLQAMVVLVHP